jgi:hypothetical protein
MSMPTSGSYVAQCASGGAPGPVYYDPYGFNQDADASTPQAACDNCLPENEINGEGSYYMPAITGSNSVCNATAPIPIPTITYGSATAGPAPTVQWDVYGNPIVNNSGNMNLFAGLGGGNAHSGLTHMQIALIILVVLLVCGTGGFLLFKHMKK